MATTKTAATKTPVKKAAPAKKTSASKTVAPRTDYKPGARVKGTRKDGSVVSGFVTGVKATKTGHFIAMNVGTKAFPVIMEFRPVKVRGY